ncbi:MAG TPA: ABC transporter ATP-binding protein [Ruminococcaceae bacterium]|nr:ABC transporter ATP-binding protein [Oscillospiraceae bacterium]
MQLEVKNIKKSFGEKQVLNDVSFCSRTGSALGLLGRNGAGKTTIIRVIMGIFPPDDGEVTIDGKRMSLSGKTFGYLPEERGLYPKQIILDQIVYIGMLRGMHRAEAAASAKQWLGRMQMSEYTYKKLNTLSKGNQQKIQLAATLVNDPDIIILDEPFSGLDPVNAQMLKDIVSELVEAGKIVIFSSHQMSYVEEFCDSIAMLGGGRIILEGNLKAIKRSYDRRKLIITPDPDDRENGIVRLGSLFSGELASFVKSCDIMQDTVRLKLKDAGDRNRLLTELIRLEIPLVRFEVLEPSLEEIFVEKAGESDAAV